MPYYIRILGRWDYNVFWLTDLLFPAWVFDLTLAAVVKWLLFPDYWALLMAVLNFDLKTTITGNTYNPLAYFANDVEAWLVAQPGSAYERISSSPPTTIASTLFGDIYKWYYLQQVYTFDPVYKAGKYILDVNFDVFGWFRAQMKAH